VAESKILEKHGIKKNTATRFERIAAQPLTINKNKSPVSFILLPF